MTLLVVALLISAQGAAAQDSFHAERAAALRLPRRCSVAGCGADGMSVLLVDAELEAILCPIHQLVLPDGSPVEGQPMLAAAW